MWPLAIVLVVLLFFIVSRWMDTPYRYAAGLALIGHLVVAVVVLPRVPYGWDIAKFHKSAVLILGGQIPDYSTTVTSFATFQSLIYTLSGPDPLALSIVNGLIAVLIPFPLRYLMTQLYPELRTKHIPTFLVLFLPLPFIMLTVPMRDSLTVLLFATVAALFVRTTVQRSLWPAIVGIPLCGMLYLFRAELALIIVTAGGAAVFIFCIDSLIKRTLSLPQFLVSTAPFAILGFFLFTTRFPLQKLNAKVTYRSKGGAVYLDSFQYDSWLDVILSAPVRAIYFQFAPFPLHVEQIFHLLALFSLPVLIVLSLCAIFSIYECETNQIVLVFLVGLYFAGVVGYGLIDSNFGTTARHRVPFVLLLVVFASPVLDRWWLKLRRAYDISNESGENEEHHSEAEEFDTSRHI